IEHGLKCAWDIPRTFSAQHGIKTQNASVLIEKLISFRVCGQLAGKRAFDGIFVQIKALFEFDAAHRAQKGTQIWAKRTRNAFCKLIVHTP
ncbi:MAG: hypothetical protein AB8G77_22885, partial [Rhodothermales bacterium]